MSNRDVATPSRGMAPCALMPASAALATIVVVLAAAGPAAAQTVTITDLWVSDDPYSDGQDYFDPEAPIAVFMSFEATQQSGSVAFAARCALSNSETGETLSTVEFGPIDVSSDDYVGSHWFSMPWPDAEVEVTCEPVSNPTGALTHVVGRRSVDRGSAASLPRLDPAPTPVDTDSRDDARATPEVAAATTPQHTPTAAATDREIAARGVIALETRRPARRR